jgi:hypothetical protein
MDQRFLERLLDSSREHLTLRSRNIGTELLELEIRDGPEGPQVATPP